MRGGSYLCHDSYCNRYRVARAVARTPPSPPPGTSASAAPRRPEVPGVRELTGDHLAFWRRTAPLHRHHAAQGRNGAEPFATKKRGPVWESLVDVDTDTAWGITSRTSQKVANPPLRRSVVTVQRCRSASPKARWWPGELADPGHLPFCGAAEPGLASVESGVFEDRAATVAVAVGVVAQVRAAAHHPGRAAERAARVGAGSRRSTSGTYQSAHHSHTLPTVCQSPYALGAKVHRRGGQVAVVDVFLGGEVALPDVHRQRPAG